jgi:hypothetical protein
MALSPELAAYSDENDFVQRFLVPLLGRLGFGIVVNHHGQSEAGMDLILGEIDRFAHVRYHGIQAKFENSIGKSASHGLVQDATEAFADEFTHPQTGAKHRIGAADGDQTHRRFPGPSAARIGDYAYFRPLQPRSGPAQGGLARRAV